MVDVLGDGNCFWRALAHQITGNENNYPLFKEKVFLYFKLNHDKYSDIFTHELTKENIERELKTDKVYANYEYVKITSDALQKDILLYKNSLTNIDEFLNDFDTF